MLLRRTFGGMQVATMKSESSKTSVGDDYIEAVYAEPDYYPSVCPVCGRGGEPPVPGKSTNPSGRLVRSEALLKLSEIATALSVPIFTIRRAAKRDEFPTYRVGRGHRRARLSKVLAAIEAYKGEAAQ
jgi:hypothetical protein